MLQLKNNTPFSAAIALFPNEQGVDTLYSIVKATFSIGHQLTLVDKQLPPQKEDVFWGEPESSSLRFASDYHTGKKSTDIILQGAACAPEGRPVRRLDVGLFLGNVKKVVAVFGDRVWDRGMISNPEPFVTMPLVYERAFGGKDIFDDQVRAAEERNPVGVGFAGLKSAQDIDGSPLPNIECPQQLIQEYRDTPSPAGFGAIAPSWLPRRQYAGTYDEAWQQERAPYLPVDYNPAFMNAAHPDLIYPQFLQGGEPVKIVGMHPAGDIQFLVPRVNLVNKIHLANSEINEKFLLETVILDPNQLQVSLVWRSPFVCDKKALHIQQVSVSLTR